jgi:hypothetical protein
VSVVTGPLVAAATRYLSRLQFPQLLAVAAALLLLDVLVPDALPFVDEIMLTLAVAMLAVARKPKLPY